MKESNKKFLTEKFGVTFTDSVYANNNIARECLGLNDDELIIDGKPVDRKNYYSFFDDINWSKLDIKEKIKLLKWACCDYLKVRDFQFLFFYSENRDYSCALAMAKSNCIIINLDKLNEKSGYYFLETIIHESVHIKDLAQFNYLLNKFKNYIPEDIVNSKSNSIYEYIIKMDLNSKHFNNESQNEIYLDKTEKENLLLLKNMIVSIIPNTNLNLKKARVKKTYDFEQYIRNLCYKLTPLEYKAFTTSQKVTLDIMEQLGVDHNSQEYSFLLRRYKSLVGVKRQISKYFNKPVEEVVNDALIYEYNKLIYKDNTDAYICKDKMQQWENNMNRLWNAKFRREFPSHLKEWIEKDNNALNI